VLVVQAGRSDGEAAADDDDDTEHRC
jgi:hypothetical protein